MGKANDEAFADEGSCGVLTCVARAIRQDAACKAAAESAFKDGKSVEEVANAAGAQRRLESSCNVDIIGAAIAAANAAADMHRRSGGSSVTAERAAIHMVWRSMPDSRSPEAAKVAAFVAGKMNAIEAIGRGSDPEKVRFCSFSGALHGAQFSAPECGLTPESAAQIHAAAAGRDHRTIAINDDKLKDRLALCVDEGWPLIVTEVDDFVPAPLTSLFDPKFATRCGELSIILDGQNVIFNFKFRLYMICAAANLPDKYLQKVTVVQTP